MKGVFENEKLLEYENAGDDGPSRIYLDYAVHDLSRDRDGRDGSGTAKRRRNLGLDRVPL